ncbi:hypothetical protein OAN24_03050, partial [Pseudodesulfovibrio sp.]|nr:hypothetical protein [Pseudodesulfovibrio sp.]
MDIILIFDSVQVSRNYLLRLLAINLEFLILDKERTKGSSMGKLCLEHLVVGMELAKSIDDPDGNSIIEAGSLIDESTVALLDALEVSSVFIKDTDAFS